MTKAPHKQLYIKPLTEVITPMAGRAFAVSATGGTPDAPFIDNEDGGMLPPIGFKEDFPW
ncbi:MAG: hypothetical protein J5699_02140 [Bacteroidales bacterium]|nr:hypothetical protein [Bacteroidales bacterium]